MFKRNATGGWLRWLTCAFAKVVMSRPMQSDEEVVEKARRVLASRGKFRVMMFLEAVFFLGLCIYFTLTALRKVESLDTEKLTIGFVYGLVLAVIWTSFGVIGALFLFKAFSGFSGDFRLQELLVRYHDRLRTLRDLPDENKGEQDGAGNSHRAGQ